MRILPKRDLFSFFANKGTAVFLAGALALLLLTISIIIHFHSRDLKRQHERFTATLRDDINRHLETQYSETCQALARQETIGNLFRFPGPSSTRQATDLLNSMREVLMTSLIYIQDSEGTVVASSFSENGDTLYGNNYRFRPYFQKAMQGESYIYPALGVTTGERGIYFSSPVRLKDGSIVGVAVIKDGINAIDRILKKAADRGPTAILSGDGIVFAASTSSWLFRTAYPLSQSLRQRLIESGQFANQPLLPLAATLDRQKVRLEGRGYLVDSEPIQLSSWSVVTLFPQKSPVATIVFVCLLFTIGLYFFFLNLKHSADERHYKEEINRHNIHLRELNEEMKHEIEERKQTEKELVRVSQQEFQYRLLFEQSKDAITIVNAHGDILEANQAFCDMMGFNRDELADKKPRDFWPDKQERRDWLAELHRHGSMVDYQCRHRRRDGRLIDVNLTTNATRTREGERVYLTIMRDISEKLDARRRLIEAKTEAEQANRAKSNFLANMSHEIRTPMNGIIGMTNMVLESSLLPNQRSYLEMVRTSADRLLNIINNILDFSKIEAGRLVLEEVEFSLSDKLGELLSLLSIKASENNVTLVLKHQETVPDNLIGDPTRLMQILINLLNNAIKFSNHGTVTLDIRLEEMINPSEALVRFSITDTGIGIPREKQASIFESFAQADTSTTREYGGTGLGLTISSQLCQLMGGEIGLDSDANKGATFWFTARLRLPVSPIKEQEQQQGTIISSELTREEIFKDIRILLVEDDFINKTLALAVLEKARLTVETADNGRQAVEEWERIPYDLILMDIQMPEMDGFEATRIIRRREQPQARHTPIIAMTAHAIKGDREKCLAAGMDDYITKPIDTTELYTIIERHLLYRALVIDDNREDLDHAGTLFTEIGWQATLAHTPAQCFWESEHSLFDLVLVNPDMKDLVLADVTAAIRGSSGSAGKPVSIIALCHGPSREQIQRYGQSGVDNVIRRPLTIERLSSIINTMNLRM